MAKEIADVINELIGKKYEFRAVYPSKIGNKHFSESTNSSFSLTNITDTFNKYISGGYNHFEVVLFSEFDERDKYYFFGLDPENKTVKLKELHYNNNSENYKGLIKIFKENEWKVDFSKDKWV